jgi:ubiquinone/menaquinone biosynthesis C-methylase UbiE
LTRRLFDTLRRRSRQTRYLRIRDLVGVESSSGFVLDLGGGPTSFFTTMFPRLEQIILLDVSSRAACRAKRKQPALQVVVADGEHLPLANHSIEVTICNSVIEHVSDPDVLASEVRRVSQGYFLQTPSRSFPLETHSFIPIPFYNWIRPERLRRLACRIFGANFDYVSSVRYLPEERLRSLFPEATITYEKALGLEKSFYVYHPGGSAE